MAAQAVADSAGRAQLYNLCGQFEAVMLASIIPQSLFRSSPSGDDEPKSASESGSTAWLFSQALSAALERAGGLGFGREVFEALERRSL